MTKERKLLTIAQLEKILNSEEDCEIVILPNGEVRSKRKNAKKADVPLTFRENLGGEYAA